MTFYKHTQFSFIMLLFIVLVSCTFLYVNFQARMEVSSYDSGTNFLVTVLMVGVVTLLASFTTMTVEIDNKNLVVKFGFGLFRKSFLLQDIARHKSVKLAWYIGYGIRVWFWPYMWIFNISGNKAVELTMQNGKIYCIGTDEPLALEQALNIAMKSSV